MLDFEKRLQSIGQQTILCVGDLMLDDFVYGEVGRISPEAPAPVLAVTRNEIAIGGAGNVARNIAALGARCIFLGVVGEDDASREASQATSRKHPFETASPDCRYRVSVRPRDAALDRRRTRDRETRRGLPAHVSERPRKAR